VITKLKQTKQMCVHRVESKEWNWRVRIDEDELDRSRWDSLECQWRLGWWSAADFPEPTLRREIHYRAQ
jgi:hypothetical protein